jgi:hypothetical protein
MRAFLEWGMCPAEERGTPPKIHVCPGLQISPELVWNHFDEMLRFKALGRRVDVKVPHIDVVVYSLGSQQIALRDKFWSVIYANRPTNQPDPADDSGSPDKSADSNEPNWQDAIKFFEVISIAKQEEALRYLRKYLAYEMTWCAAIKANIEWVDSVHRKHPHLADSRYREFKQGFQQYRDRFETEHFPAAMEFFKLHHWEEHVRLPDCVRRFLPPGFWPHEPRTEARALVLGAREVPPNDRRIDPARLAFYVEELGCRKVLETRGWFDDRNYVAFLLRAASGQRVAILDCAEVGNAAYLFHIGGHGEEQDRWTNDAVRPKWELLHTGGPCGTFIRRFIHSMHWRERVREYLASH